MRDWLSCPECGRDDRDPPDEALHRIERTLRDCRPLTAGGLGLAADIDDAIQALVDLRTKGYV